MSSWRKVLLRPQRSAFSFGMPWTHRTALRREKSIRMDNKLPLRFELFTRTCCLDLLPTTGVIEFAAEHHGRCNHQPFVRYHSNLQAINQTSHSIVAGGDDVQIVGGADASRADGGRRRLQPPQALAAKPSMPCAIKLSKGSPGDRRRCVRK